MPRYPIHARRMPLLLILGKDSVSRTPASKLFHRRAGPLSNAALQREGKRGLTVLLTAALTIPGTTKRHGLQTPRAAQHNRIHLQPALGTTNHACLLYTSDAAAEEDSVDIG